MKQDFRNCYSCKYFIYSDGHPFCSKEIEYLDDDCVSCHQYEKNDDNGK